MHKEKLGESTGPWCKILVDDQKIICMVKKIPFMTTEYASRGIITRCKSLEKTEGWSLQKHCGNVQEHFMDWCNKNEKNQPEVKLMERRGTSVKHGGAAVMGFWVSHLIELHSTWWRPDYRERLQKEKEKKARGQRNVESNLVWTLSVWLGFPRGIIDRHTPKSLQMDRVTEQHSTERKNVNTRRSSEMSDIIQKPQCIR